MPINLKINKLQVNDGNGYTGVDVLKEQVFVTGYTSPEIYGAIGDGITDDTAAWQSAVNSGMNVIALSKQYKCGKINVTKNITIDCNRASFICTDTSLFNCTGTVTKTLSNQPDYTANQRDYSITSASDSTYTGFAMLQGTNNFIESRTYYYGGFVCSFNNGVMTGSYPIDVENTTILLISPITATIKNVENISYVGTSEAHKNWVCFTYGVNCSAVNFNTKITDYYILISFSRCLNCVCENLSVVAETGTTGTNSYIVSFGDSSFCCVKDSYLYNKYWHCITTGANYLCYRNLVVNCCVLNDSAGGFCDHDNGIGTILRDCVIAGCLVGAQAIVDNVRVISENDSTKSCVLTIIPPTDPKLSGADITNVVFDPDENNPFCGININTYPQVSGKTYYVDNIRINSVRVNGNNVGKFNFGFASDTTNLKCFTVNNLFFNNCDLTIDLSSTSPYADLTNMVAKKAVYETV